LRVRKSKRNWLTVERFSVLRKEQLQVPRCKLLVVKKPGVGGWWLEVRKSKRNWFVVERFSVLRKEQLQVPRCKLLVAYSPPRGIGQAIKE